MLEGTQIFQRAPYYEFRGHLKKNCLGVLEKRMLGPNLFSLFPATDAEAPNKGGMGALFQRGGYF